MSEYHLPLEYIVGRDPRKFLSLDAGLALIDARRERLHPGSTIGYLHRAVARARDAVRTWHEERHTILPHAEFLKLSANG